MEFGIWSWRRSALVDRLREREPAADDERERQLEADAAAGRQAEPSRPTPTSSRSAPPASFRPFIELLVNAAGAACTCGISHRDALVAATEGSARVLQATDIGRLAVGDRADFVLYRGNVEDGGFEQARVLAVGKGGVLYVTNGRWAGR